MLEQRRVTPMQSNGQSVPFCHVTASEYVIDVGVRKKEMPNPKPFLFDVRVELFMLLLRRRTWINYCRLPTIVDHVRVGLERVKGESADRHVTKKVSVCRR